MRALLAAISLIVAAPAAAAGPFTYTYWPSSYAHEGPFPNNWSSTANAWGAGYTQANGGTTSGGVSGYWTFASSDVAAALPADATVTDVTWYIDYYYMGGTSGYTGANAPQCHLRYGSNGQIIHSENPIAWVTSANATSISWSWNPGTAALRNGSYTMFCSLGINGLVNSGYWRVDGFRAVITYTVPDPVSGIVVFTN